MEPFKASELIKDNPLDKLFKTNKKENTLIEIKNYLAFTDLENVKNSEINKIIEKNNIKVDSIIKELEGFFEDFVSDTFQFLDLNTIEISNIKNFAVALGLNFDDLKDIVNKFSKDRFCTEIKPVINNGKSIHENEKELLSIKERLSISDDDFKKILDETRIKIAQDAFKEATRDGEYSPEGETRLQELYTNLDITPDYDAIASEVMEKGRLLWKIKNENLPVIKPDINLASSEICHYTTLTDYYEYKTVTSKIGYFGPALRLKIVKGFYYKAGIYNIKRSTEEKLTKIDSGKIYITNKRIILIGTNKTINIRLNKILDIELFSNGMKIIKDVGRNIFFSYFNEADLLGLILLRAISDYKIQ